MPYSPDTNTNILNNQFAGVYRTVLLNYAQNGVAINEVPVVCQSFSDNSNIRTTPLQVFDGKGISNTNYLGNINEEFSLSNAPILIGANPDLARHNTGIMDGLDYYFYCISNLFNLNTYNYSMPLMKSCSLNVTDTTAGFNFDLISDGIRFISSNYQRQLFLDTTNYNIFDFDVNQVSSAYNSDFIVAFGPYKFFIKTLNYSIQHNVRQFSTVRQSLAPFGPNLNYNDANDGNMNYQFLVPGKMTITANGTAVVQKESLYYDAWTNYDYEGYPKLNLQSPGFLSLFKSQIYALAGNQFELYIQLENSVVPLFRNFVNNGIRIDSAYITTLNLTAGVNELSIAFNMTLNASIIQNS